jgi:hypothetical protein
MKLVVPDFTPEESRAKSLQELFDMSKNHIEAQGMPSMVSTLCRYRNHSEGEILGCAAGPMVPDSALTDRSVVNEDGIDTGETGAWFERYYTDEQELLIKRLQNCHDDPALYIYSHTAFRHDTEKNQKFMEMWRERMKALAEEFKLNF